MAKKKKDKKEEKKSKKLDWIEKNLPNVTKLIKAFKEALDYKH